jgi:sugar lactone lactonase YvrE
LETVVGTDHAGDGAPTPGEELTPPGPVGTTVGLNHPTNLAFGPDGLLYFTSWEDHKIRRVDPSTGRVTIYAGSDPGFAGDGDVIANARFNFPRALAFSSSGALFVLDQRNLRVRKIQDGQLTTVAGSGSAGFSGDGGDPLLAQLNFDSSANPNPSGGIALAIDGMYIADSLNHRIRKITFATNTISTIAGTGSGGFSGDGGPATMAKINNVQALAFGPDGRLYLADTGNHRVRVIDLRTGVISTVAGRGVAALNMKQSRLQEGLPPAITDVNAPHGLGFDSSGMLFVADTFNHRIVEVAIQ